MYGTEHFLYWHPGNISLCQDFRDFKKHFKEFLLFWNSHLDLKSIHVYLLIVWTIYQFSLISMSNWLDNIDKKNISSFSLLSYFVFYICLTIALEIQTILLIYHPLLHTHPSGNFLGSILNVSLTYKVLPPLQHWSFQSVNRAYSSIS